MKEMNYYKIVKKEKNVEVEYLYDVPTLGERVREIPKYKEIVRNNGYSYSNPSYDGKAKEIFSELPNGEYIAAFEYEYFSGGWASGSNWYGEAIYKVV